MSVVNGNSGTVDDFEVLVHAVLLTEFPNKSPLEMNIALHVFFNIP